MIVAHLLLVETLDVGHDETSLGRVVLSTDVVPSGAFQVGERQLNVAGWAWCVEDPSKGGDDLHTVELKLYVMTHQDALAWQQLQHQRQVEAQRQAQLAAAGAKPLLIPVGPAWVTPPNGSRG